MKGHETDAAAKLGMNDAAQLEHDRLINERGGSMGEG